MSNSDKYIPKTRKPPVSCGDIFKSNLCGEFMVLKYNSALKVDLVFLNTGYTTTTRIDHTRTGTVSDKLYPNLCGFGFIGIGDYKAKEGKSLSKPYAAWSGMIKRCYEEKRLKRNPTYRDCTVCDEWRNFQSFAKWFEKNYIEGYQLDKDILVDGNKIYSPEFCSFVTPKENIQKAHAKNYKFISPDGNITQVYNLSKFCDKKGLSKSSMCQVSKGKFAQYKGWKAA